MSLFCNFILIVILCPVWLLPSRLIRLTPRGIESLNRKSRELSCQQESLKQHFSAHLPSFGRSHGFLGFTLAHNILAFLGQEILYLYLDSTINRCHIFLEERAIGDYNIIIFTIFLYWYSGNLFLLKLWKPKLDCKWFHVMRRIFPSDGLSSLKILSFVDSLSFKLKLRGFQTYRRHQWKGR